MNDTMRTEDGWYIRFAHETGTWFHKLRMKHREIEITVTRRTVCEVVLDDNTLMTQGVAYCSPTNNYDHEIGRQVALFQAMTMLPKGSHAGHKLKQAYLTRPGARMWMLDKHGHPLPWATVERKQEARSIYGTHRHARQRTSDNRENDSRTAHD